jgi:hypothetical protein
MIGHALVAGMVADGFRYHLGLLTFRVVVWVRAFHRYHYINATGRVNASGAVNGYMLALDLLVTHFFRLRDFWSPK